MIVLFFIYKSKCIKVKVKKNSNKGKNRWLISPKFMINHKLTRQIHTMHNIGLVSLE